MFSGGVDPLERKALKKMAERYQVQLSFAREGSDEKLAGVKVTLIDYKGDKALELFRGSPSFSPILLPAAGSSKRSWMGRRLPKRWT